MTHAFYWMRGSFTDRTLALRSFPLVARDGRDGLAYFGSHGGDVVRSLIGFDVGKGHVPHVLRCIQGVEFLALLLELFLRHVGGTRDCGLYDIGLASL